VRPEIGLSGTALRWNILGEWRAQPGRVIIAVLAIAVGVALGFAVHLINASALSEFARAIGTVNGEADLQVRAATPLGFDEALYPRVLTVAGVSDASPVVELDATTPGLTQPIALLGIDVLRAGHVTPKLLGRPSGSASPLADEALFLSRSAMEELGTEPGRRLTIVANGRSATLTVAGSLPGAEEQRLAVIDIGAAQWRFGKLGRLNRVDLKLAAGADPARVRERLGALLPAGAGIETAESQAQRGDSLSRAYRVNLNMLALMALLTGAFLVYSAQTLSVARRRAQFALLRVLGMERRGLIAQVLVEGGVLGLVGAALGLGLGLLLASLALRVLGGDLGGGYFSGATPELIFAPVAAVVFFVLGMAAAFIGSILPAREAARAQPAVALKNAGDAVDPNEAPRARAAVLLGGLGVLAAFLPAVGRLPLFGYASIALLLAGGVAAMPWVARRLLGPLQRLNPRAPALDLALKRLWGAPSQAAVALCGIVASTSLMIAMAVMVASFRTSVDEWLGDVLGADLYLHVETGGGFDPGLQRRLASTPGIGSVEFSTIVPLRLSAERPPVSLIARRMQADPASSLPLIERAERLPAGLIPIWPSEPAARSYGFRLGERVELPLGGGGARFVVAGVWRDYARQHGAIAIATEDYARLTGDPARTDASIELSPGAAADIVVDRLRAQLPTDLRDRVALAQPGELRALSLRIFDRSFAVTYVLEAVAILVGLAGVAATFSAQVLARAKEFGMLRHIGVQRGEIVAMLATEGALLGAVGVVAGILLGVGMSQVLIHVVNPQSFGWTMETRIPWAVLGGVAAALVISAAGTAMLAGRRAVSGDAVRAVREDW
jgi:putative ABC transport system permease protein